MFMVDEKWEMVPTPHHKTRRDFTFDASMLATPTQLQEMRWYSSGLGTYHSGRRSDGPEEQ